MIRGVPYDHELEYSQGSQSASAVDIGVQMASVGRMQFRYSFVTIPTSGGTAMADYAIQDRADVAHLGCWVFYNNRTRRLVQYLSGPGGARYGGWPSGQQTWFDATIDCTPEAAVIDGVTYPVTETTSVAPTDKVYLHGGYGTSRGKMYYFKTWDLNGNPQRDMVPVSDGSGRVYWYDRITRRAFFPTKAELMAGPVASTPLMGVHMYPTANLWKWPTRTTTTSGVAPTTVWTPVLDVVYPRVSRNGYVASSYPYDPFVAGPNTIVSSCNTGYGAAVFRALPPGRYKISADVSLYSGSATNASILAIDYAPSAGQWVYSRYVGSGNKPFGVISTSFTVESGHLTAISFFCGVQGTSILVKDVSLTEEPLP